MELDALTENVLYFVVVSSHDLVDESFIDHLSVGELAAGGVVCGFDGSALVSFDNVVKCGLGVATVDELADEELDVVVVVLTSFVVSFVSV